jgi:opacity protein-like surface antigen
MKRLFLAALFLTALFLPAYAADKSNTVLIHPGETIYARFEPKGKKIRVVGYSKEKDDAAQVVFTLGPDAKKPAVLSLKVENKFPKDLTYKLEMRSLTMKMKMNVPVTPVVSGKVAFEQFPPQAEELALTEFQLEK